MGIPTVMYDKPNYVHGHKIKKTLDMIAEEAKKEHMYSLAALVGCIVLFSWYLYKEWIKSQEDEGDVGDKIAEINVQAMKDGKLTLRGVMAQFRDNDWANQKDLDKALDNPDALSEVRNMCKILAPFFASYDVNGDNEIDFDEFRMIFKDVHENLSRDTQENMFAAADVDNSKVINFEEFVACILCFALEAPVESEGTRPPKIMLDPKTFYAPEDEDQEDEDMPEDLADLSPEEQQKRIKQRAFSMMGLGTLLVVVFSDPMVDLLGRMGEILGVSAFYVSFLLAPMASNASELVAASNYAAKKTKVNDDITLHVGGRSSHEQYIHYWCFLRPYIHERYCVGVPSRNHCLGVYSGMYCCYDVDSEAPTFVSCLYRLLFVPTFFGNYVVLGEQDAHGLRACGYGLIGTKSNHLVQFSGL